MSDYSIILGIITVLVCGASLLEHWVKFRFPYPMWKRGLLHFGIIVLCVLIAVVMLPDSLDENFSALIIGMGAGLAAAEVAKRIFRIK